MRNLAGRAALVATTLSLASLAFSAVALGAPVHGGPHNDRLSGGPHRDHVRGGAGNDAIVTVGGRRDIVHCGAGRHDRTRVDRRDRVFRCERVAQRSVRRYTVTVSPEGLGSGTVTGRGIACPGDCSEAFTNGKHATLRAAAAGDSSFSGWGADCSGTGSCHLTLNADHSVTAGFDPLPPPPPPTEYALTVTPEGLGSGTATGPGIACPGDCSEIFTDGTQVTLSASPGLGATFSGWSGDCSGTGSCTVTMNADHSVTAGFDPLPPPPPVQRTLTVSATGPGSVTGPGIACPGDCTQTYDDGTQVSLSAAPDSGASFSGWSGACSGSGSCNLTLNGDRSVGALFASPPPPPVQRTLTVSATGPGSVTGPGIACPGDCTQTYDDGTQVSLSAAPDSGASFSGWSGACSGSGSCNLTLNGDRSVGALFASPPPPPVQRTLTVSATGPGSVTGPGIACPGDCTQTYDDGTQVSLSAAPDSGASFSGWSGACSGSGSCNLTLNGDRSVGALFASPPPPPVQRTLTVSATGPGSVTGPGIACPGDCTQTYDDGTQVSLSAAPDSGASFSGWSGACSGSGSCNLTLNGDRSVGALFASPPPPTCTLNLGALTAPVCTVVFSDSSTDPNPLGIWGAIDCQSASRVTQLTNGGDTHATAAGTPPADTAARRMTVLDGEDFWGERCELGRNGSHSAPNVLYHEGQHRITFMSIRLQSSIPNTWQDVMQMKQTQPADNGSGTPALSLYAYWGRWGLMRSNSVAYGSDVNELWSAPARTGTWTRFAFDVHYSQYASQGSIKVYVDLNGDGDATDPGEQSPTFNTYTLKTETAGTNSDGIAAGESIPSHLRAGIYHNPTVSCPAPAGCAVDVDNVQVVNPG